MKVIHRVSISTFEVQHDQITLDDNGQFLSPTSKDKPWLMYKKVKGNNEVRKSVESTLDDLININSQEEPFNIEFSAGLNEAFIKWVQDNGIKDPRFVI